MHYHFGDFMLDEAGQELRCREAIIALEPKAFQVLCYLLRHRDRVVSRDELFAQCWPDTFVSDWALTRCVARIRKAVGNGRDGGACIKTIHSRGYRFVAPLTVTPNATALPPASLADRAPALMFTTRPTQGEAAAAERRVLTVLCGVLVDPQACQRDPEEVRGLVQAYHAICAEVIHALEGYVAQYLRDAVIAYFGVPQAHDDDAQRSVWAGLRLRDALQARLAPGRGNALSLRVGIHTGPVVVGELGPEQSGLLAVGETPAIAEQLTALALPGTVVISAATARLVEGYVRWQAWDAPGAAETSVARGAYQVLGERPASSRFEVATQRGLTPMVGREAERGLLRARWAEAAGGLGQVVVIMGEPGIGKSRLVQSLADQLAGEPYTRIEWRCSSYAQQSPLQPVIAHLHRVLHWRADETPDEHLAALEAMVAARHLALPELVPLLASFLAIPLPARYAPLALTPQRQREKTLEAMLAWLRAEAMAQPVLFIVEDLHWMDPSTLELLTRLLEQGPVPRLLTLLTCRPEFALPWGFRAHLTPLTLPRLPQAEAAQMIGGLTDGTPLPPAVIAQIVAKTDGVPLFIEELTKMMLESGLMQERDGRYELPGPLPPLAIPATLHDSLMARLDRLSTFKAVAQLGATIGRMFPYELLRAVTSLDEVTLQQGLRHLVAAELVYQQGLPPQATYLFKHALIQEAAYQSLLKSTRQQYHQRIAQVLVERFPALVETQPEVVAQHYTAAGVAEHAVHYWHQAGRVAQARSAHEEAIVHLTSSLTLLRSLPATRARDAQELTVRIHLGTSLAATQGWAAPAAEATYTRAWELCQRASDTSQRLSVLWGLAHVYVVRADLPHHREVGARMRALAAQQADPVPRMVAHWLTGQNLFHTGELAAGLTHLEHAYALYDAQHHRLYITLFGVDIGVFTLAYLAHALWGLGYAAQAVQRSQEALGLAQARQHPFSHALAHAYAAMLQQWRRDPHTATAHAEAAMALGREHGFAYYLAWGRIIQGWCLRDKAQPAEGMAEIREGLTALRATGGALRLSYYLALLAEAHGEDRQPGEGLRCLTEAFVHQATTHERWTTAELSRLKGEWLLRQTPPDALQAEACFRDSLDLARGQHAKSLELRAAMSLSRLWQQQGKRAEAHELLAPIYDWFTEGFDTADLQDAKALLEELGG